jgi:hypothetical protein
MIDIDQLNIEELYVLNERIVARIKFLEQAQAHLSMMQFNLGAKVSFETAEGRQFGRLVKRNQKTVNVETEDGRSWRISPHLLTEVKDVNPTQQPRSTNLAPNNRRKKKRRR